MVDSCAEMLVGAEKLLLCPDRAVFWPSRSSLIVADTHFGKSTLFRHYGLAVPDGVDDRDRQRLDRLLTVTAAERLIVLGDFLHAPLDGSSQAILDLAAWSTKLKKTRIDVVAGNHDRNAPRDSMAHINWHDGELDDLPFRFTHHYGGPDPSSLDRFTLSGHLHPVARLLGLGKRAARVPVFWQHGGGLVLPSFGAFTGGYVVRPRASDQIYAAGPERVVRFR